MDPLRQTDSAISVASRDQFFHDRKSNNVVSSEEEIHSPPPPLPLDSSTSASTPSSHKQLPQQPHEESRPTTTQTQPPPASSPTPNPTQPSAAPPPPPPPLAAAAAAGSSPSYPPATAISVTHRATMENLIAPLDVAQRHPPPLFVDRPDPSWYETQLRPPTPPKYDVDPAISSNPPTKKSTAESSSNNTTPPVSVGSTSTPGTSAASTSDATAAATFTSTTTTDDSAPLRSASRARSQSPFSPTGTSIPVTVSLEDPHEREAEERQEEEEESRRPTYAYHEAQDPEALDALAQAGSGAIVVDQEQLDLESDPGYESDRASFASTSLSSSVRDYLFENGRRYHRFREGRYNFPNDEPEQDREDMKHQCVKMLCQNQLFFAPIDDGGPLQNILDIGTGTGLWAIEMGDQFPSANVMGIDLSPIQPEWVPANVHFVVDDAESEWIYPDNHFDYIHTRHTVMAIKDWPRLYRTAQQYMRPGGWIESQEIWHYPISANNTMAPDNPIAQYWGLINEGLQRLGVDFHACAGGKIAKMMRDAGYQNVHERIFHVPIGTWAKHPNLKMVGEYWRHVLLEGIQAIALGPLTRGCGWTRDQVEVFLIEVRRAYYNNSCLMYMPMYVTYGQKPEH